MSTNYQDIIGGLEPSELDLPKDRDWTHPALDEHAKTGTLIRTSALWEAARLGKGRLAYLATPYSKIALPRNGVWSALGSYQAGIMAADWARRFALEGVTAISPIVQAVEMIRCDAGKRLDPLDAEFWEAWCLPLMAVSSIVIVPPIPGWGESDGIWHEVREALRDRKKVVVMW